MVIVIVRWYIKKDQDEAWVNKFKSTWRAMEPKKKDGLFREFFSKPTEELDNKYHTLDLESEHYSTYVNVGLWKSLKHFDAAIGKMIPGRKASRSKKRKDRELIEVFDFEFKLRERLVMEVEVSRGGDWDLPSSNF